MNTTSTLLLSCLLTITSFQSFAQNLIKNGQFNKKLNNWAIGQTSENQDLKMQVINRNIFFEEPGLVPEHIDNNFVELTHNVLLQQNIMTTQKESYTLIFACAHRPDAGDQKLVIAVDGITVLIHEIPNTPDLGFFQYQKVHFSAPSSNSQLSFYVISSTKNKNKGVFITDVICQKTSETNLDEFHLDKFASKH